MKSINREIYSFAANVLQGVNVYSIDAIQSMQAVFVTVHTTEAIVSGTACLSVQQPGLACK